MVNRRSFFRFCAGLGLVPSLSEGLWQGLQAENGTARLQVSQSQGKSAITRDTVRAASTLIGVPFTEPELDLMVGLLETNLAWYRAIRDFPIPYDVQPAIQFSPLLPGRAVPAIARPARRLGTGPRLGVKLPSSRSALAFMTVAELGELIRTRQITSTELTRVYLDRLSRYGPELHCVVTQLNERALDHAAQADRALAAGRYLGPLHGIPYGVKDLFAVPGFPTSWGASIYRDRVLDVTATAVERLDAAGAVLLAKLSTGELALNQTWFGGKTLNAWRRNVGAGGSSGGSAVATAAGLAGFALGTETLGSIVTPATRNGVTGLRPTFGRVSRHGVMSLSWSLDKVGPMARSVEDCAMVLEVLAGADGKDPAASPVPFYWDPSRPLAGIKVGFFESAFQAERVGKGRDDVALDRLRSLGVKLIPVELPTDLPIEALKIVLVEAAAAFDQITRTGEIDSLKEQHETGWPNFFRSSRMVPAVEYLQANRVRTMLMHRLAEVFDQVDVFLAPSFGVILVTNLTGHPCVVVPNGFNSDGLPASISFVGNLYREAELCTVARAWQELTGWHRQHPAEFNE
jgi:Asp-tRNA(Asn)/Glu-tRNA(Gln) amidotransferase A subunit family amidase